MKPAYSQRIIFLMMATAVLLSCKPTKTALPSPPLVGTTWNLAAVNGVPLVTPADARAVHFVLEVSGDTQRLHGYAGCNNITGGYTTSNTSISFTVASTRMMCSAEKMEIEDFFLAALSNANRYTIDASTLILLKDDTALARFTGTAR